jgi:hypothetical protein
LSKHGIPERVVQNLWAALYNNNKMMVARPESKSENLCPVLCDVYAQALPLRSEDKMMVARPENKSENLCPVLCDVYAQALPLRSEE